MEPDMVGVRLRQIRKARRLTQAELAEIVGIPQGTISHVETGRQPGYHLAVDTARRLAFALGVSLDALVGVPAETPGPRRSKGL
jgi:transcriptional regulator with XRE-family HTH domain